MHGRTIEVSRKLRSTALRSCAGGLAPSPSRGGPSAPPGRRGRTPRTPRPAESRGLAARSSPVRLAIIITAAYM